MEGIVALGLLIGIGVILGVVFGWIAFFQLLGLKRELYLLRTDVARLRAGAPPPRPAPDSARSATLAAASPAPAAAPAAPRTPPTARSAAPPAPLAPPPPSARGNIFAALERSLAGNWLVWVAAAALILGGVFIARVAIERGLVGPWGGIALAALAGLAMIAGGEWLRRNPPREGVLRHSLAPAVLAGAGVIVLYATAYVAKLIELVPDAAAFGALAAVAAGAVALALLHGPILVALGLVGAFAAPILIGSDSPNAATLFAYVLAVAGAGLAVCRLVGRLWPALIALAGGAAWPLLWLLGGFEASQVWALALYLPALLALAAIFAWRDGGNAIDLDELLRAAKARLTVALPAAILAGLAALGLGVLLAVRAEHAPETIAAMAAMAVMSLALAWRREGFGPLAVIAAGATGAFLLMWPEKQAALIDPSIRLMRILGEPNAGPEGPPFLTTSLLFAALFGFGGLIEQRFVTVKGWFATTSALAPVIILAAAYWRLTGIEQDWRWAAAALALAAAQIWLVQRARAGATDERPDAGPLAAYALGASSALAMAIGMALDQLWMSVGFAFQAVVSAWVWRRLDAPVLRWAALAAGALAVARLTIVGEAFGYDVGAIPIFNWLLLGYGASALALWGAARLLTEGGLPRGGAHVQGLEGGAIILGVALISMEIRHAMGGGRLDATYDSLIEMGLQTSAWAGAALGLRWRLGPTMEFAPRWIERALIALALGHWVLFPLLVRNPWWGWWAAPVEGSPPSLALILAYALPGAIAAGYAFIARAQGLRRSGVVAGLVGAGLLFVWATLQTRHAFHAPNLDVGVIGDQEHYAYSAVWLAFAAGLLGVGFLRRRPSMRYAALGLLVLVTIKVFLSDMAGLEGLLRGLSFLGLGAALMGIAVFYQRIVLPQAQAEAGDPGKASR